MAGTITVGGLATGLDTSSIISQLVALESQPLNQLQTQRDGVAAQQSALQTLNSKVLAFLTAVDKVRDNGDVIARQATSSNTAVLTATASGTAAPGTTSINVTALAQGAIATSSVGALSATSTVTAGAGSFTFRVGSGQNQTIAIDATTTLQGLATKINGLAAGVSASVVNAGTAASPDYRLRIASTDTGASQALTIVQDDTTLGVTVTQQAANSQFTVTGFTDPLSREHNTFDDVIPGVSVTLLDRGPATVTVGTDTASVNSNVQSVVNAFNDVINYVNSQSQVRQDTTATDHSVTAGPLAFDGTVRSIVSGLHAVLSSGVSGLQGSLSQLSQIGITTNEDGTLAFDTSKLDSALAQDEKSVDQLFSGGGTVGGVADRLHDYLTQITGVGSLIAIRNKSLTDQISSIDDQLAAGQQHIADYQAGLQQTFANLELTVNTLKSQGAFLLSSLGVGGGTTG
ncbi:MAG TPA: flagellar filament capping protein FliD [Candidatus Binatia bacterium]|jgi:flagellar hook-associated protein 2